MPKELSKKEQEREKEILKLARARIRKCIESDNHNRVAAIEDLRFLQGDQWEPADKQRRKDRGRPCLQINVLPKYSKQVCGEMRRNKSQIKIRPVDSKADIQISKIREGIIYNIEYLSNSEVIYDHAAQMLVDCGYGAWRVLTRYTEEDPFMQEIYLERILNPFSVFMDPAAKDPLFADAEYGFIITKMSREDFEDEYGEKAIPGGDLADNPGVGLSDELYWDKDNVSVAEYFAKEYEEKTMCQLSNGQTLEKKEAEEYIAQVTSSFLQAGKEHPEMPMEDTGIPNIVKERVVREAKLMWRKITAVKILEEQEWASGRYIPIILVTGEETNIEGKKYIHGLIRHAKDPQRMLNYWHSSACETVALAPKAPWQATAKMIEGYEKDYLNANEDNLPVMLYNPDDTDKVGRPTRLPVGQPPVAIFSEIGRAESNIKSTIGMYNTDVGDTSGEHLRDVSGSAVMARQMPGDTATFVYPDNMARAIAHGGKIVNDLITYIYDTERDVRLRQVDGSETFVPINTTVGKAFDTIQENPERYSGMNMKSLQKSLREKGPDEKFNSISVGKYDVVVTTGPTFATQRVEAVENMVKLAIASRMSPVDKYFILKNSDFPGADDYAEVVRRMIPPNLLPPKEGQLPVQPPPPLPKDQVAMAKTQLEMEKIKVEKIKLQKELLLLQREIKESDSGVKKQILDTLNELSAPVHPADMMMGMGQGNGNQLGVDMQAQQGGM